MSKDISLLSLVPEAAEVFKKRYSILSAISNYEPIGRRLLADKLHWTERTLREEIECLRELNLIYVSVGGMSVTQDGKKLLFDSLHLFRELNDNEVLADNIKTKLGINHAVVVRGDLSSDYGVLLSLGKEAAYFLTKNLSNISVLGITGGSTMASVAEAISQSDSSSDLIVVPARGGQGRKVDLQANTIAAKIARKLSAEYRLVNFPDNVDISVLGELRRNPDVDESLHIIDRIDGLLFGIGDAVTLAKQRSLSDETVSEIIRCNGVAEAFGRYFDINGKLLSNKQIIGLDLNKIEKMKFKLGVAGGAEKAKAIIGICRFIKDMTLVTDEEAAEAILSLLDKKE